VQVTCPSCSCEFPVEAGYADADGKRLAALFAEMEPALGRAVLAYLRLFKPAKNALRMSRAIKIVQQLLDLVNAGSVCRDERNGVRRPASPTTWTAGIEQMLQIRANLVLPIESHNYLRAIVFGIADSADAHAERRKEAEVRVGKHRQGTSEKADPITEQIAYLNRMVEYGSMSREDADEQISILRGEKAHGPD
jgi:hypothetical protein